MANKIIFLGVCVDSIDPAKAGRIRAVRDEDYKGTQTPADYDALTLRALLEQDKYSEYATVDDLKWSKDDPHLVSPFLPLFINVVPKESEAVKIIFYDPGNDTQNKEYIGPLISSPEKLPYDKYTTGRMHTSRGTRVTPTENISDSDISNNTFAEPTKISLEGRSNADIVFSGVEGQDGEITMRAGKFIPNVNKPEFPIFNPKPTTIQLNNFPTKLSLTEERKVFERPVEAKIRYLVEYDVFSLDTPNNLNGNVKLYELIVKPPFDLPTNLDSPGLTTNFQSQADLTVRAELNFTRQQISGATILINEFLEEVGTFNGKSLTDPPFNEGTLSSITSGAFEKRGEYIDSFSSLAPSPDDQNLNLFPFYFRPAIGLTEIINSEDPTLDISIATANKLVREIGLTGVNNKKYYGFVLSKEEPEPKLEKLETTETNRDFDTSTRQGLITALSDKIILYSYDSEIPNKPAANPIVENENNNEVGDNLGLSQDILIKVNDKETEPVVRGDQLTILLEKIVEFLKTHVHGEANTPAVSDGVQLLADIDDLMRQRNYLNRNIRIN